VKNKIFLAIVFLFITSGFTPLAARQQGDRFAFKEDIFVASDEIQDNVIAFGAKIIIEGKVREDVFALGGTVTISGEVGNAVVGIGSKVILKPTAVIRKDVVVLGGTLEKELGCQVEGDTVYFKSSEISVKFLKESFKGIFSLSLLPIILIIKFVSIFIWFLLTFLVASLFPKPITLASTQIRNSFWATFGLGFLAIILYTGFTIISAFLCFLLIGIPILLSLILAGFIVKIFGRVVLFYFFGESLAQAFNTRKVSVIGASLLGLLLVSLIGFIPFIGFFFSLVLSIIGWGAVIRTKFGTTENWFARQ